MFEEYIHELECSITQKENLALIRSISKEFVKTHSAIECWNFSMQAWSSPYFQVQELSVFICGYIAHDYNAALKFLEAEVTHHSDWRVQEVLAMAFDNYCKSIGYQQAIPVIQKWLDSPNDKQRRAVTEGLRVWTSRNYFKENPQIAINILSKLKTDESAYVRKSVGNALRDISKKFPGLVSGELANWDISDKRILQVHKLAYRYIKEKQLDK